MARSSSKRNSKRPRMVVEERLTSRFYEPLVLQHVLDRNGGQRTSRCPSGELAMSHLTQQELRRVLLDQLAYVCDYLTGGDTVTAMGLEAQPFGTIFRVACNTTFSAKAKTFLHGILSILQTVASSPTADLKVAIENSITEKCITFNLERLKSYNSSMLRYLLPCLKFLARSEEAADKSLADWLQSFRCFDENLPSLCQYAYQERSSPYMRDLQRHIGEGISEMTDIESTRQNFLKTRHFIGRLGSHLKASKILNMAALRLPELFENFTIEALPSSRPALTPPPTDGLTTLKGIVKRMLSSSSDETPRYQEDLALMDAKFGIQKRLLKTYENPSFTPRVHCELIVHEHFYRNGLPFADNDRFVGCSKPACYCCYHYITFHPGGLVRPNSHGIRYINWRAPDLVENTEEEKTHQRDIMNKMIAQIRSDTLRQINGYKGPSPWRADSTTGITYSIDHNGLRLRLNQVDDQEAAVDNAAESEEDLDILALSNLKLSDSENEERNPESEGGVTL